MWHNHCKRDKTSVLMQDISKNVDKFMQPHLNGKNFENGFRLGIKSGHSDNALIDVTNANSSCTDFLTIVAVVCWGYT